MDGKFIAARRRARLHGLGRRVSGLPRAGTLPSFEEERRAKGAYGGFRRGRSTLGIPRIVGSACKHDQFDDAFMPLRRASRDRWKRIDRA